MIMIRVYCIFCWLSIATLVSGFFGHEGSWNDPPVKAKSKGQYPNEEPILGRDNIDVQCMEDFVIVAIRRKAVSDHNFGPDPQISFKDRTDQSCFNQKRANNRTHYKITTFYRHCGTTHLRPTPSIEVYRNQVVIRRGLSTQDSTPAHITQSALSSVADSQSGTSTNQPIIDEIIQDFTCSIYLSNTQTTTTTSSQLSFPSLPETTGNETRLSYRLELYDLPFGGAPWGFQYPREVYLDATIYARIRFGNDVTDEDLRAIPKECYFSIDSNPLKMDQDNIYLLLTESCPYSGNSDTVLYESKDPSVLFTRVAFRITTTRYFGSRNFMFLHCRVTACSIAGGRQNEGYDKCPPKRHCSEVQSINSSHEPPVKPKFHYLSTGPIRPVIPDKRSSADVPAMTCPPCPALGISKQDTKLDKVPVPGSSEPLTQVVSGLNMTTVIGISFASFLVGVLMVAGLWYIHDCTEPKKFLAKRRNSSHDSAVSCSDSSLPIPIGSLPNMRSEVQT